MSEIIIGIDPGASGGIAFANSGGLLFVHPTPETERDTWDMITTADDGRRSALEGDVDCFAFIEHVSAMPKQGVSSTFKFGQHYGMLRGFLIAAGIPFETVTPSKWQGAMKCRSKGDKNVTKRRAQQLFPNVNVYTKTGKITHAVADAMLIAEYGRRVRNGIVS